MLIHAFHDDIGPPASHLLNLLIRISQVVKIRSEEVPHFVKREVRDAELLLRLYKSAVNHLRIAIVNISLFSNQIRQIGRNKDGSGGIRGFGVRVESVVLVGLTVHS